MSLAALGRMSEKATITNPNGDKILPLVSLIAARLRGNDKLHTILSRGILFTVELFAIIIGEQVLWHLMLPRT